jgi:hypothetical protein
LQTAGVGEKQNVGVVISVHFSLGFDKLAFAYACDAGYENLTVIFK